MSARIYASPKEVGDPPAFDSTVSWQEFAAREKEWEEALQKWCAENGKGDLRGKEFTYGVGDGYARYFVFSERPLALVWCGTGDAWQMPEVVRKGLDLAYVKQIADRGFENPIRLKTAPLEFVEPPADWPVTETVQKKKKKKPVAEEEEVPTDENPLNMDSGEIAELARQIDKFTPPEEVAEAIDPDEKDVF